MGAKPQRVGWDHFLFGELTPRSDRNNGRWLVKTGDKIKITGKIVSKFAKKTEEKSVKNPQNVLLITEIIGFQESMDHIIVI